MRPKVPLAAALGLGLALAAISCSPAAAPDGTPPAGTDDTGSGSGSDDTGGSSGGDDTGDVPEATGPCAPADPLPGLVRRDGDQLHDDAGEVRFISVNVPNLHVVEDGGWHLPDPWEQRDALCAVRQMGGGVARTYVISVGESGAELPRHVTAPGEFQEELFVALDHALAQANEQGVRLLIPLVDQWTWWGGIEEYAAFRGLPSEAFWTDEQVISDFEQTVDFVVGRVNTVTGVPYAEDPAILAWETGNELDAPTEWTARIAARIKALDPDHLVMDGRYGIDPESLDNPDIDIVSNHYYWPEPWWDDYAAAAAADHALAMGKRPFVVGEFGLVEAERVGELVDRVIDDGMAGALIWSLRFHAVDGGWYWHWEAEIDGVDHRSFRWPGFDSGAAYGEAEVLQILREGAHEIRGVAVPELEAPEAPVILEVSEVGGVSWRGSTGAASYTLERSTEGAEGAWETVAEGFDDAAVELEAEVVDPTEEAGEVWYRLRAVGPEGAASDPSEAWGPVDRRVRWTDPLDDLAQLASATSGLGIDGTNPGYFDGDTGRLYRTEAGEQEATWEVDGELVEIEVVVYAWPYEAVPELALAASVDGTSWTDLAVSTADEGGDWIRLRLTVEAVPAGARWLRVGLPEHGGEVWNPQVAEVHLTWAAP